MRSGDHPHPTGERPRRGEADPGRPRRRPVARFHLPEGIDARTPPRRSRSAAASDREAGRRVRRGRLGRGVRHDRGRAPADPRRARPGRVRDLPREPGRPQPRPAALQPHADPGTRHRQPLLGLHGRPAPEGTVGRDDVRIGDRAGPRSRSHRLPPDARRQPPRLERFAVHGARLPRPPRPDPGARRRAWSSSTRAAARRPPGPISTSRSGRAPTPTCSLRSPTCSSPTVSPTPGRLAEHTAGLDDLGRRARPVHTGGGRGGLRARRRHHPDPGSRSGRGADRCRVRADRHLHPGVRHARLLAGRRREPPVGQPRPGRRARCSPPAQRVSPRPRGHPVGPWAPDGTGHQPRRQASRVTRGVPRHCAARGDRDAGRGASAGARHGRRQSGVLQSRTRHDSTRRSPRWSSWWLGRPVRQRDDPSRRRDPPAAVGAREVALRRRAARTSQSTTSPTTPRPCSIVRTTSRRNGRSCSASLPSSDGGGIDADIGRARRPDRRGHSCGRAVRDEHGKVHERDIAELAAAASATVSVRNGCSTSCCAPARSATASAPNPPA